MLKKILIALLILVVVFIGLAFIQPDEFTVQRSTIINAPVPVVFVQVNDFHKWAAWSPWEKLDPSITKTYSGSVAGKGATYTWSGNSSVGAGSMTITDSKANDHITINLEFTKPFKASNVTEFMFAEEGRQTVVTWKMSGKNNFISKVMSLFIDMDELIGGDFERGLADLKSVSEGL